MPMDFNSLLAFITLDFSHSTDIESTSVATMAKPMSIVFLLHEFYKNNVEMLLSSYHITS